MGLYGRNDVMSVAVPLTAGGCGATHSRPVADGVAADEWNLEAVCIMCAASLRGDPLWAATSAEIPETYDERTIREDAEKRGERTIKKAQERLSVQQGELNERIVELLERGAGGSSAKPDPELIAQLVAQEVQKALATAARKGVYRPNRVLTSDDAPQPVDTEQVNELTQDIPTGGGIDLMRLHVRTLGKMCREKGLDSRGSKADLVDRLLREPE